MRGLRTLAIRSALLPALAVYLFLFTNIAPSLHTCSPFAHEHRAGGSSAAFAPRLEGSLLLGFQQGAERRSALDEELTCVACLFSARTRGVSPPADVSGPLLARTQRLHREAVRIPARSTRWIRIPSRAPPANDSR